MLICYLKSYYIFQSGTKGWQDGSKLPGHTLGNLTPADRHGSVQVIFLEFSLTLINNLFIIYEDVGELFFVYLFNGQLRKTTFVKTSSVIYLLNLKLYNLLTN